MSSASAAVEAETAEVSPTVPDSSQDNDDQDMVMEKGSAKGALSTTPEKAPLKKKQAVNPFHKGLTEVHNPGAGDCPFHSLSQSLEKAGGGNKAPLQCRARCVAHLTRYTSMPMNDTATAVAQKRATLPRLSLSAVLPTTWKKLPKPLLGSALEVTAFALTHDRPGQCTF